MQGKNRFIKGHQSIDKVKIDQAPFDTDWTRYAMLHDGQHYRLFFFKIGSNDTLYQFGFNRRSQAYEYGYKSIPVIHIAGVPIQANTSSFAMLHDGKNYRLFFQDIGNPFNLYQFVFNPASNRYEYGYQSIPKLEVTGMPMMTATMRWGMLHDGNTYRLYMASSYGSKVHQAAFNPSSQKYEYGYNSIPEMEFQGFASSVMDFALVHDRDTFRFYLLLPY